MYSTTVCIEGVFNTCTLTVMQELCIEGVRMGCPIHNKVLVVKIYPPTLLTLYKCYVAGLFMFREQNFLDSA